MSTQRALDDRSLPAFLAGHGWIDAGEISAVEPAGDGNINWVRRVRTRDGRTWIVKQARPALERFPEYRVSTERIVFEHRYYDLVKRLPVARVCPTILLFDERQRVLLMEDLSAAERLDAALARGLDVRALARELGRFLGSVHAELADSDGTRLARRFANDAMRRLHGDHIFRLPLEPNDFPLAPRVRAEARRLATDAELARVCAESHERYLEPRGVLVHGDVQAGNILIAGEGPKLLDAEICHVGDGAFDLGVLIAHLITPALARSALDPGGVARRSLALANEAVVEAWNAYRAAVRALGEPGYAPVARYAGIEMLRRTIGAARIPSVEAPESALVVLERACHWILDPPGEPRTVTAPH